MATAPEGEMVRAVQRFQVKRMQGTHAALFRSPRYGPLCAFFVQDLYGPRDVAPRTATFHSVSHLLRPILGQRLFLGAQRLVELQRLSDGLDGELARRLVEQGASTGFAAADFETAFRLCDNHPDRQRQLELSIRSTIFVHDLSRRRSVKHLFRAARKLKGMRRLHSTLAVLDRGYVAFRKIDEIRPFTRSMRQGEVEYMERVFESQPVSDSPS